jgi:hypothetical protein
LGQFYEGLLDQLILYVRHTAWLHATPKDSKGKAAARSRLESFRIDEEAGRTRIELIMPPIEGGDYIVGYLFEVGPSCAGEPLSFCEIEAWARQTGRILNCWEPVALKRLSNSYLAELQAAEAHDRPAPNAVVVAKPPVSRKVISDQLGAIFDRLAAQDAKHAPPVRQPRPPRPPRPGRSRP